MYSVSVSNSPKDIKNFVNVDVPCNAQRRFKEERKLKETDNITAKLDHMMCKNEAFINDKKYKYILITNDICKVASCCNMESSSDLDFAKSIEWEAVFDFNPNSFKDGIGQIIMKSKDVLVKPCNITGEK